MEHNKQTNKQKFLAQIMTNTDKEEANKSKTSTNFRQGMVSGYAAMHYV